MLRLTWKESLEYIHEHTGIMLTEQGFFTMRRRVVKNGRKWILKMQKDRDLFLGEYKQRYEEMLESQRKLCITYDRAMEEGKYNAAVAAQMGYHTITNDIARLIDMIPYVGGGIRAKVGTLQPTEYWPRSATEAAEEEEGSFNSAEIPV